MRFGLFCPGDLATLWKNGRFGLYPGDSRIIHKSWHRCKGRIILGTGDKIKDI